jgi:hypothetical protein
MYTTRPVPITHQPPIILRSRATPTTNNSQPRSQPANFTRPRIGIVCDTRIDFIDAIQKAAAAASKILHSPILNQLIYWTIDWNITMTNPSQQLKDGNDEDSSVSTTNKDTPSVQLTPAPKSKSKKSKKSSTKKQTRSPGLTEAEQDLYNTHAEQIRQNAMQLLNTEVSPTSNRYRSYHDSAPAASNFISSDSVTGNLPSWNTNNTQSFYGVGDALSVSQVASMAFNCIAHCLTEGYRAASNYYSESQGEGYDHNYAKVGGDEGNIGEIRDGTSAYQQQMDRGLNTNQSSGQGSTKQMNRQQAEIRVKGEYATVSMPSTYQGGNIEP